MRHIKHTKSHIKSPCQNKIYHINNNNFITNNYAYGVYKSLYSLFEYTITIPYIPCWKLRTYIPYWSIQILIFLICRLADNVARRHISNPMVIIINFGIIICCDVYFCHLFHKWHKSNNSRDSAEKTANALKIEI